MNRNYRNLVSIACAAAISVASFIASIHVHTHGECSIHSHVHQHTGHGESHCHHHHSHLPQPNSGLPIAPVHDSDSCTLCDFSGDEFWFELPDFESGNEPLTFALAVFHASRLAADIPANYLSRAPPTQLV